MANAKVTQEVPAMFWIAELHVDQQCARKLVFSGANAFASQVSAASVGNV